MKFIRPFILFICIMLTLSMTANAEESKKEVIIAINELNLGEFYSIPVIKGMMEQGSIGLMNTKTSSKANTYKAYTTIGAGTRAEASSGSLNFLRIDDEILKVYKRRTGIDLPQEGIVNLNSAQLKKQNRAGEYGAISGSLGQALQNKGKKTTVIGNSDTDEISIRLAPAIAMDNNGYINYGEIDKSILEKDYIYPLGLKTDYIKMLKLFKTYISKSDFIVIDLGDISRLERSKTNLSDEQYKYMKSKILNDINEFIKNLLNNLDFNKARIIIVSPYPSSSDIRAGRTLTPILVYGEGISSGVLYSDTTRREGIIGNIDIAPSVANYLDADIKNIQGKAFNYVSMADNYNFLINLEKQVVNISNYRYPVLSAFAIFEILISLIALSIVLFKEKFKPNLINIIKVVLLSTMIIPITLLIVPIYNFSSLEYIFLFLVVIIGIFSVVIHKVFKPLEALLIISGITTFLILIDVGLGANLIKKSVLGYDPIIGARYYGIGNEYMGVLIGSTLIFATALLDRFKFDKKISLSILLITIIIIGLPKLGANVGGTITAVAAFTYTALRLYKIKIRPKQIFLIGFIVIAVVFIMAFIDIKLVKNPSHLAGAIENILKQGPSAIFLIINRKIAMNLKLIGVTIWSKVLLTTIIIIGILFYRPVKTINKLADTYPHLSIGWTGIVAGCMVAFAVNDSGIVAAATSIIFLATSLLYLSLFLVKD